MSRDADELVARGLAAGDRALLIEAVAAYETVLAGAVEGRARAQAEHNLGTLLCLLAQDEEETERADRRLAAAQRHLTAALAGRRRAEAPLAWALTEANLALVHLTRYRLSGEAIALMAAHMAIEEAREAFRAEGAADWLDWAEAIHRHLLTLR